MAMLGWVGGVMCLTLGGLITFYSYNLLSLVLEHHAQLGKRQLRFRDMAHDILGTVFLFASFLSFLKHHAQLGKRHLRFRDMGRYF